MSKSFTGVHTLYVRPEAIQEIYQLKTLGYKRINELELSIKEVEDAGFSRVKEIIPWHLYPNLFMVLTAEEFGDKKTAIVRVGQGEVSLIKDFGKTPIFGLRPKNKEQHMLLNTLTDENVRCQVICGRAGSGKTICALATALHLLFEKKVGYEKIILTRPMSPIGKDLGSLPGEVSDKFLPYLNNYFDNVDALMGSNGRGYLERAVEKGQIEFLPLQLIGGASWHNAIVIADEVQSLNAEEMYALGTRPASGTKLILLGDYRQRYGQRASIEQSGLWRVVNSDVSKKAPEIASIELIKTERSRMAALFGDIFQDSLDA